MHKQYLLQRCILYFVGVFSMTFGIALSCKADMGTTPISSIPWVMSMFTSWSIGEITVLMNMLFIIVQPVLLKKIYWHELVGQVITILFFGYGIDFSMYLLNWVQPDNLFMKWVYCILSTIVLSFGVFLCVRAKIFLAAGEGLVLVIAFISKLKFSNIKTCFDVSLVAISFAISMLEFHQIKGIGLGTVFAAISVGRIVQFYNNKLHIFDKWLITEN